MGSIKKTVFICSLVLLSFADAEARVEPPKEKQFSYYVRVPATGKSCSAEAESLALRFKQFSKLENVSAVCKAENKIAENKKVFHLFSIAVTYLALDPVQLYSAKLSEFDNIGGPSGAEGVFEKYEQCLLALPAQVASYEISTELRALVSACEPGTYSGSNKYVLRIDGIGKPRRVLQGFALSRHYLYSQEFIKKIKDIFNKSGLAFVLEKEKSVWYYSEWPLAIQQISLGYFSNPELCRKQIGEANAILAAAGSEISEIACLSFENTDEDSEKSEALSLVAFHVGGHFLKSYTGNSSAYYSFEECLADKEWVFDEYRNAQGKDPLGAICGDSGEMYRMTVFEK